MSKIRKLRRFLRWLPFPANLCCYAILSYICIMLLMLIAVMIFSIFPAWRSFSASLLIIVKDLTDKVWGRFVAVTGFSALASVATVWYNSTAAKSDEKTLVNFVPNRIKRLVLYFLALLPVALFVTLVFDVGAALADVFTQAITTASAQADTAVPEPEPEVPAELPPDEFDWGDIFFSDYENPEQLAQDMLASLAQGRDVTMKDWDEYVVHTELANGVEEDIPDDASDNDKLAVYQQGNEHRETADTYYAKSNNQIVIASNHINMGDIYQGNGDTQTAYKEFELAILQYFVTLQTSLNENVQEYPPRGVIEAARNAYTEHLCTLPQLTEEQQKQLSLVVKALGIVKDSYH